MTPTALIDMTEHARQMERELAAERALADRLAGALGNFTYHGEAMSAINGWKEARKS